MKINKFISPFLQSNCYLITSGSKAIIIDPSVNYKTLKPYLLNYQLAGIFLTHGHCDHFLSLHDIYENVKCNIYLHENAIEKLVDGDKNCSKLFNDAIIFKQLESVITINDSKVIIIGDMHIHTIMTPGHTNCSVCYLIDNSLFTGDTLFHLSVGRTDLYSSNLMELRDSLQKLKSLSNDYKIYPGHGESTTLFTEIASNQFLRNI